MIELTPYISAIVMLLGILVGTVISPRIQRKISEQHGRKDILFRKKLEYFEKILETIEKNKKMYNQAITRLEGLKNNKEIKKIINLLKKTRKNFSVMASPLYFNIERFSEKIIRFVRVEKEIFNRISSLYDKDRKEIAILINPLKEHVKILNQRANEIIFEMRKELMR